MLTRRIARDQWSRPSRISLPTGGAGSLPSTSPRAPSRGWSSESPRSFYYGVYRGVSWGVKKAEGRTQVHPRSVSRERCSATDPTRWPLDRCLARLLPHTPPLLSSGCRPSLLGSAAQLRQLPQSRAANPGTSARVRPVRSVRGACGSRDVTMGLRRSYGGATVELRWETGVLPLFLPCRMLVPRGKASRKELHPG